MSGDNPRDSDATICLCMFGVRSSRTLPIRFFCSQATIHFERLLPETTLFHIMGFLKRLFSIGSKKNKSKRVPIIHNVPLPEPTILPMNHEDHEAAVGRLLRSTSARVAETSELDYATLPPIRESFYCILLFGN